MDPSIQFENGSDYKKLFQIVSDIVEDATFKLKPEEGLSIKARRNAMMVLVDIPLGDFEEWNIEEETDWSFSLQGFMKVVKRCKKTDSVRLSQKEEGKLKIEYIGDTKRTFVRGLIPNKSEYYSEKTPELPEGNSYDMEVKTLEETLDDIELHGSEIKFKHNPGELILESAGSQVSHQTYSNEIGSEDDPLFGYAVDQEFTAKYGIKLFNDAINNISNKKVNIKISEKNPISLNYEMMENGEIEIIIAPRVDTET